jgi:hypothetical protein
VVDGRRLTVRPNGSAIKDAETSSTWNALGEAVAGPLTRSRLTPVPHVSLLVRVELLPRGHARLAVS